MSEEQELNPEDKKDQSTDESTKEAEQVVNPENTEEQNAQSSEGVTPEATEEYADDQSSDHQDAESEESAQEGGGSISLDETGTGEQQEADSAESDVNSDSQQFPDSDGTSNFDNNRNSVTGIKDSDRTSPDNNQSDVEAKTSQQEVVQACQTIDTDQAISNESESLPLLDTDDSSEEDSSVSTDKENPADPVNTSSVAINVAPTLSGSSNLAYTENDAVTAINNGLIISDIDDLSLASAKVTISDN